MVFFGGVYARKLVCAYACFNFSAASTGNILGAFLKLVTWLTLLVTDIVLYFYVLFHSTLMSLFGVFSTYGITWGFTSSVSAFISTIFIFGKFTFFLV